MPAADCQEQAVAITNARIITVTKGEIEGGTILIREGKIAEVGKDIKVPTGTRVIDGKGLTAFPSMVHPHSRLGLPEASFGSGGAATPHHLAYDEFNPSHDVYSQVPRTGVTAYGLIPSGGTIAGQGVVVKPVGWSKDSMVAEKSAFVRITLQANTAAKDALRQALDGAKRAIEAEKKPAAPPPATPAKPGEAPAPKPEEKPAPKPDERALVIIRFLKGELPALVETTTAGDLLHFWQVMEPFAEFKTRIAYVVPLDVYKAAEELGRRKARVILRPWLTFAPFTRDRINPAAELVRAGAEVALAPPADSLDAFEGHLFRVAELVKYGLPRDAALRSITIVPAEILGLGKRIGSIEAGKDADLLLFDGDPLAAQSRLRQVFINGKAMMPGDAR